MSITIDDFLSGLKTTEEIDELEQKIPRARQVLYIAELEARNAELEARIAELEEKATSPNSEPVI